MSIYSMNCQCYFPKWIHKEGHLVANFGASCILQLCPSPTFWPPFLLVEQILPISILSDGEIWIGLKKADDDEDECFNAGCNSILQWKDGSSFEYHSWMGHLSVDEDDKCFRLSYGSNIISGSCNQWIEGHICQFNCPGKTRLGTGHHGILSRIVIIPNMFLN